MTLSEAADRLRAAGIPEPLCEARRLFESFARIPVARQIGENPVSDDPALADAVARRAAHEPLAYLLGEWGFYRESYLLSPDCLIPREDTELLAETAIASLPRGARFADLCTGCGCVGLSVLAHTDATRARLLDISEGAVHMAKRNAARLGLEDRAEFLVADVCEGPGDGTFDAILSNPPYIKNAVYPTLSEEVRREPPRAFLGGEDGMDFYRVILAQYKSRLTEGGFFAFEIGFDEETAIRALAASHGFSCEVRRDLSGNPRVALLKKETADNGKI